MSDAKTRDLLTRAKATSVHAAQGPLVLDLVDEIERLSAENERKGKQAFIAGFQAGYHADEPKDLGAYKVWKSNA